MIRPLRAIALVAAVTLGSIPLAFAQTAAPATPAPPPAVTPAPPPAVEPPPAPAPTPAPPPAAAPQSPMQNADAFGEELTLTPKTVIYLKGNGTWDTAFETLVDAFKSVYAFLDKQGVKRGGPSMTIYTKADDTGFEFRAAVPVDEPPKDIPKGDMAVGQSPGGRALKFVHRGSYDAMDNTYEAITNYLDDKKLEAQDVFIEEYVTDPVTTKDEDLVVNVYVPIK